MCRPDRGLPPQVRAFHENFSAFTLIKERFFRRGVETELRARIAKLESDLKAVDKSRTFWWHKCRDLEAGLLYGDSEPPRIGE